MLTDRNLTSKSIIAKIRKVYQSNYQSNHIETIEKVLKDVTDLFRGKKRGYQKCDVNYHNIYHTLQTIPPFIEIIDGWNMSEAFPKISKEYIDLGIIAVLLHDTGYIKTINDRAGTGAKYTFSHIQRSVDFTNQYLKEEGFSEKSISCVRNAIVCTGVSVSPEKIHFNSDEERIVGYTLGSADLLGQMSSPDYLQKLFLLFNEFEEAYRFEGMEKLIKMNMKIFNNADELIKDTVYFYNVIVSNRFLAMGSMYKYLTCHFGTVNNPYIEAIEENIRQIQALYQ